MRAHRASLPRDQQGDQDRLQFASQTAALAVARANVVAQQAVVNRLVQLTGFEQITAPFDGVITSRQRPPF
jgi:multidrug efflux pump subunit AcrA (membrane-fusion protein)